MKRKYIGVIFLMMCQACHSGMDSNNLNHVPEKVKAVAGCDSKTILNDSYDVIWQNDDQLSVFAGSTENNRFLIDEGAGTNDATFVRTSSSESYGSTELSLYYAVYPYSPFTSISADAVISLEMPSVQEYSPSGFSSGASPMVACAEKGSTSFYFRNLCSILKFRITGNSTITSLVLKGNNGEMISGLAKVSFTPGGEICSDFSNCTGDSITLTCENGVALSTEPTEFLFVVPPVTFSEGFSLCIYDDRGGKMTSSSDKELKLERSLIHSMSSIEYCLEDPDYVQFADGKFEKICLDKFDVDKDGRISVEEARKVTRLEIFDSQVASLISSLKGIEFFENLSSIILRGNENGRLKNVDLSKNTLLSQVEIINFKVENLNLSNCTHLLSLTASGNNLSSLDLSSCPYIVYINVSNNPLSDLILNHNAPLTTLMCEVSYLSDINLSEFPALKYLGLLYSMKEVLDVSQFQNLNFLSYSCWNPTSGKSVPSYLIKTSEQSFDLYSASAQVNVLIKGQIYLSEDTHHASSSNCTFTVDASSSSRVELESCPDWIRLKCIQKKDTLTNSYRFELSKNVDEKERRGEILFHNEDGTTKALSIEQEPGSESGDWRARNLFHTSLFVSHYRHLTTGGFYPYTADEYSESHPNKIVSLIPDEDVFGTSGFEIGWYNDTSIDLRYRMYNRGPGDLSLYEWECVCVEDRERLYPVTTGFSITTDIKDNIVSVDVNMFIKEADTYKLAVFACKGNEVFKYLSQSKEGDTIITSSPDQIVSKHYEFEADSLELSNGRIVAVSIKPYGQRLAVHESCFGDSYVDNCAEVAVGKNLPLRLVSDASGGNEGIVPGDDIDL